MIICDLNIKQLELTTKNQKSKKTFIRSSYVPVIVVGAGELADSDVVPQLKEW
jgi:hypothetical protein